MDYKPFRDRCAIAGIGNSMGEATPQFSAVEPDASFFVTGHTLAADAGHSSR